VRVSGRSMEWCCDDGINGINILWQKNTMYHMVQFTVNKLQLTYHTLMYRTVNYTATYSIRQSGSGSAATRSTYIMFYPNCNATTVYATRLPTADLYVRYTIYTSAAAAFRVPLISSHVILYGAPELGCRLSKKEGSLLTCNRH